MTTGGGTCTNVPPPLATPLFRGEHPLISRWRAGLTMMGDDLGLAKFVTVLLFSLDLNRRTAELI